MVCVQQRLRPACAYAQSDQSLCLSLEYSLNIKLLHEHHLEFLSLKGGCTGSSESSLVKIPHCWISHVTAISNLPFSHLISPSVIDSAKAGQLTILTSSPANRIMLYSKCSKISNTSLFLLSYKILVFRAGSYTMFVRIANWEGPDQTDSWSMLFVWAFWQATSVQNFRSFTVHTSRIEKLYYS